MAGGSYIGCGGQLAAWFVGEVNCGNEVWLEAKSSNVVSCSKEPLYKVKLKPCLAKRGN